MSVVERWEWIADKCEHMLFPILPQLPIKCELTHNICSPSTCPKIGKVTLVYNEKTGKYRMLEEEYPNRWSGTMIHLTKDCNTCNFFTSIKVDDDECVVGICFKGVAWKVLVKAEKLRKCTKIIKGRS